MTAEQLKNLEPDKVTLYDVAQTLAVVVTRMDDMEERREEAKKHRAAIDAQAASDHADVLNNLAEQATAIQAATASAEDNGRKLDVVIDRLDAEPGGLTDHESRLRIVEVEKEVEGRIKTRTRNFWKDPLTVGIVLFIIAAIVLPLSVLAWTALDDQGKLDTAVEQSGTAVGQSTANCKRSFNGLANQFELGNYTRKEYADAVIQLTKPDASGNPGCDPGLATPLPAK